MYGASTGFYHAGADYPRFGFRSLISAIADCLKESGGKVETNKRVSKIFAKNGNIFAGYCENGYEFKTDIVISNIAPGLLARMLNDRVPLKYSYTPSHSVISTFIGLNNYPRLKEIYNGRNVWWQDGNGEVDYHKVDMMKPPRMLYTCSPSCNGSQNRNDSPDMHSLMIFSPGSYRQDKRVFEKSSREYENMIQIIKESGITQLEKHLLPNIRSHIRFLKVITPLGVEQEIYAEQGGVYGRRSTPKSMLTYPLSNSGKKNLIFACAATGAAGIAPGMQTATLLAEKFIGISI